MCIVTTSKWCSSCSVWLNLFKYGLVIGISQNCWKKVEIFFSIFWGPPGPPISEFFEKNYSGMRVKHPNLKLCENRLLISLPVTVCRFLFVWGGWINPPPEDRVKKSKSEYSTTNEMRNSEMCWLHVLIKCGFIITWICFL